LFMIIEKKCSHKQKIIRCRWNHGTNYPWIHCRNTPCSYPPLSTFLDGVTLRINSNTIFLKIVSELLYPE
jgi:hypothetical protein